MIEKQFFVIRKMIELSDELVRAVRVQNYYQTAQLQKEIIVGLKTILENRTIYETYFQAEFLETTLLSTMKGLLDAQEHGDYILYGDLIQLELVPFLQALQASAYEKEGILLDKENIKRTQQFLEKCSFYETLCKIPDPPEEEYHIVPSSTGALTVQIKTDTMQFYLHSNVDPVEEADLFVEQYFDCSSHYVVYGLGLGYHIAALNKRCIQAASIDVYESDMNIIKLAYRYGLPEGMLTDNVHIYHDLYCKNIAKALGMGKFAYGTLETSKWTGKPDFTQLLIHYPSIRNLRNPSLEEIFDKFMVKESSIRNNQDRMLINFRGNTKNVTHYADELQENFKDKDVYLIAAGPSLDLHIEKLRNIDRSKSVILSVGTVFHKMVEQKIMPDYVVFLDPGERTYGHIKGLEKQQIPILVASTAYRLIAERYEGPKYLICQNGYYPAEQYAKDKGIQLYDTGGSVSTIALDVAIRLGAKRIICMGLDLAYPGSVSHATGTMDRQICDMSQSYQVKSFNGGVVNTSNLFLIYREWIEKRIKEERNCRFFNVSEGGAYIEGMKHCRFEEINQ